MSSLTSLTLPESLPFPVKISSIHVKEGQQVRKHEPLLSYSYWEFQDAPDSLHGSDFEEDESNGRQPFKPKKVRVDLVGTFESPIDGVVSSISVKKGEEIMSSDAEIAKVEEPCTHSVQFGGLCALCGKSLDEEADYSGYKYEDRAPISMSHGTSNLKISKDEAEKVEEKWQKSLIAEKRLILVVDLDQTVIHATVDPTIGEWMKDESNPNYPSLKDVQSFALEEEVVLPPHFSGMRPEPYTRTYYVKLRPGLEDFLEKVSKLYELHIYTMGTRSYAKAIANCIDPDGKYFADRILSRDESGSLTQKSLERLFPTDTSMVVIIDDRGDVWNWSDHLVKVVPFDFFVGIGDINSNFLPRQKSLLGPTKRRGSIAKLEEKLIEESQKREPSKEADEIERKIEESKEDGEDGDTEQNAELLAARSSEREATLDAQKEDRPLAKLQKNLDELASHTERLLYDDDDELQGLESALVKIHDIFYDKLEKTPDSPPNIKDILPAMKTKVFEGLHFVFSGLLPLGADINRENIVIWVKSFGATVTSNVTLETTHIIAKNPYTFKARLGMTIIPGCKIMHPDWLFDSMTNWRLAPEKEYEVEFLPDRKLPESEASVHRAKIIGGPKEDTPAVETPAATGEDLLGGDLDWLNENDEDEEEFLSSDTESNADNDNKRSAEDDDDDHDYSGSAKRAKYDTNDNDDNDDDDDDDDDFAAELMQELED